MANKPTSGKNIENLSEKEIERLAEIERKYELERGTQGPESILVRGALLQCSCGTHCRRLNLPESNGVYVNGDTRYPKVHEKNCKVGDSYNISYYGVCKSNTPPEGEEDICLEPYVWPDGTKSSPEKVEGKRCKPQILGKWLDAISDEKIVDLDDNKEYQGLTTSSFLVCKCGGIIAVRESGQNYNGE